MCPHSRTPRGASKGGMDDSCCTCVGSEQWRASARVRMQFALRYSSRRRPLKLSYLIPQRVGDPLWAVAAGPHSLSSSAGGELRANFDRTASCEADWIRTRNSEQDSDMGQRRCLAQIVLGALLLGAIDGVAAPVRSLRGTDSRCKCDDDSLGHHKCNAAQTESIVD